MEGGARRGESGMTARFTGAASRSRRAPASALPEPAGAGGCRPRPSPVHRGRLAPGRTAGACRNAPEHAAPDSLVGRRAPE